MDAKSKRFLHDLLATSTPSGYEEPGQAVVAKFLGDFADDTRVDVHGNLHASRNANAPFRVMLCGHVDEIGLMIMHIDAKGFLYVAPVGGVHAPGLQCERVLVHTANGPVPGVIGAKPIHMMDAKERENSQSKIHEYWVDIGAKNKREAEKRVALGDVATIAAPVTEMGGRLVARGMDDRIGVFVVAEAMKLLAKTDLAVALHVVSTVQEEIGLRGARTSAFGIDPHIGIAVDVSFATDVPGANPKLVGEAKLGGGPILHRGAYSHNPAVHRLLQKAAKDAKIKTQMQPVANLGAGTDGNALQINRAGVAVGVVSIPNRYMHSPVEMVDLADVDNAAKLLARFVANLKGNEKLAPGVLPSAKAKPEG